MPTKTKIISALLLAFAFSTTFASVDVSTNLPSGTYDRPIRIELQSTDSTAKTFYSFKPDGYPQDVYLYTGSFLLRSSTPIVFFSVIGPGNESKIKINEYILEYSSDVRFLDQERSIDAGAKSVRLSLVNNGAGSIDIGYWQVQSEAEFIEFPENTVLAPGEKKEVIIAHAGSSVIALRSPDGDERGILVVHRDAVIERQQSTVKTRTARPVSFVRLDESKWQATARRLSEEISSGNTVATGATSPESILSGTTESASGADSSVTSMSSDSSKVIEATSVSDSSSSIIPASDIKVSVTEAKDAGVRPVYLLIGLGLLVLVAVGRYVFVISRRGKGETK